MKSLMDLWYNKRSNTRVTGVPKGGEKNVWAAKIFEGITAENFSNLEKDTNLQI